MVSLAPMNEMDGRTLSDVALAETRVPAVKQVEPGESPGDVIAALGLHRSENGGKVERDLGKGLGTI